MEIAIIKSGFISNYLEDFLDICHKNNISIDVFNSEEEIGDKNKYDFIYSDGNPISSNINAFHRNSIIARMNQCPFLLYKLIFLLGHYSKIKKTKKIFPKLKKLIVVSNDMKKDFSENYKISKDKIYVIPAGFVPYENSENFKFKHFDYNKTFIISCSANGFVTKGGYNLLRALRKFRKMYPDIKIQANIIYPRYKKNFPLKLYLKFFRLNDCVKLYDYQSDMQSFYRNSNCLICTSILEAFGRVVTEAMNCKVPVILGSNIGAADIIEDKINGFIFENDKNKATNLARKIKEVYDNYNTLDSLVEKAYEDSLKLTWANFANKLFECLCK